MQSSYQNTSINSIKQVRPTVPLEHTQILCMQQSELKSIPISPEFVQINKKKEQTNIEKNTKLPQKESSKNYTRQIQQKQILAQKSSYKIDEYNKRNSEKQKQNGLNNVQQKIKRQHYNELLSNKQQIKYSSHIIQKQNKQMRNLNIQQNYDQKQIKSKMNQKLSTNPSFANQVQKYNLEKYQQRILNQNGTRVPVINKLDQIRRQQKGIAERNKKLIEDILQSQSQLIRLNQKVRSLQKQEKQKSPIQRFKIDQKKSKLLQTNQIIQNQKKKALQLQTMLRQLQNKEKEKLEVKKNSELEQKLRTIQNHLKILNHRQQQMESKSFEKYIPSKKEIYQKKIRKQSDQQKKNIKLSSNTINILIENENEKSSDKNYQKNFQININQELNTSYDYTKLKLQSQIKSLQNNIKSLQQDRKSQERLNKISMNQLNTINRSQKQLYKLQSINNKEMQNKNQQNSYLKQSDKKTIFFNSNKKININDRKQLSYQRFPKIESQRQNNTNINYLNPVDNGNNIHIPKIGMQRVAKEEFLRTYSQNKLKHYGMRDNQKNYDQSLPRYREVNSNHQQQPQLPRMIKIPKIYQKSQMSYEKPQKISPQQNEIDEGNLKYRNNNESSTFKLKFPQIKLLSLQKLRLLQEQRQRIRQERQMKQKQFKEKQLESKKKKPKFRLRNRQRELLEKQKQILLDKQIEKQQQISRQKQKIRLYDIQAEREMYREIEREKREILRKSLEKERQQQIKREKELQREKQMQQWNSKQRQKKFEKQRKQIQLQKQLLKVKQENLKSYMEKQQYKMLLETQAIINNSQSKLNNLLTLKKQNNRIENQLIQKKSSNQIQIPQNLTTKKSKYFDTIKQYDTLRQIIPAQTKQGILQRNVNPNPEQNVQLNKTNHFDHTAYNIAQQKSLYHNKLVESSFRQPANITNLQITLIKNSDDHGKLFSIFPKLPEKINPLMNFEQLLQVAKITFRTFNIKIKQQDPINIKKFRNCVYFNHKNHHILWHYSGKFYLGGWTQTNQQNQGVKSGKGIQYAPKKYIYEGQFLRGKRTGFGIMCSYNGDSYAGQWYQGVRHGKGKMQQKDNTIYQGEWRNGKKQGIGKLRTPNRDYYEGHFDNGMKNGFGKQIYKNGDSYKGQFKYGQISGQGIYRWSNGAIYQGSFVNGKRHGKGKWRSNQNQNCDQYVGQYKQDRKNGRGKYTWVNKSIYQGQFLNDMKHGQGVFKFDNGKILKAIWQNGAVKQKIFSTEDQLQKQKLQLQKQRLQEYKQKLQFEKQKRQLEKQRQLERQKQIELQRKQLEKIERQKQRINKQKQMEKNLNIRDELSRRILPAYYSINYPKY